MLLAGGSVALPPTNSWVALISSSSRVKGVPRYGAPAVSSGLKTKR